MIHPFKAARNFATDAKAQYDYMKEDDKNVFQRAAFCALIPITVPLERACKKNQGF